MADTGGAIRGNRVDVFRQTFVQAIRDGVKARRVVWLR